MKRSFFDVKWNDWGSVWKEVSLVLGGNLRIGEVFDCVPYRWGFFGELLDRLLQESFVTIVILGKEEN